MPVTGTLHVMAAGKGDVRSMWDRNNPDEVAAARKTFDELRGKGYLAFRVDAVGDKGVQITTFEPDAGKVIMSPPLRGGG